MPVRLMLVEDHAVVRQALRVMLEREDGFHVVAEAGGGEEARRLAAEHRPDVVLMDLSLDDLTDGADCTRSLCREYPGMQVIALSAHTQTQHVRRMFEAGARGYLPKESAFEDLAQAIRTVMGGQVYVSPRVAHALVEPVRGGNGPARAGGRPSLTPRERQVLGRLSDGLNSKQIGLGLGISSKTVDTHRRNLMEKLQIHSVAELVRYALREGLAKP